MFKIFLFSILVIFVSSVTAQIHEPPGCQMNLLPPVDNTSLSNGTSDAKIADHPISIYAKDLIIRQESSLESVSGKENKLLRNYLALYLGVFEYNIGYERNILNCPRSYSNIRLGFGCWTDEPGDASSYYINPSFVFITGHRSSHFEVDLGTRLFFNGTPYFLKDYPYPKTPADIFLGYRFESPDRKSVFRIGVNFLTLFNVGYGVKF